MHDGAPRREVSFGARSDCHQTGTCVALGAGPLNRLAVCNRHGKTELRLTRMLFGDVESQPVPSGHRDGWA